jgi:putative endonuclease
MEGTALGRWGEELAAEHLRDRGWTILSRNYRSGRKEIDLVASRGGVVAFVEVKTRSSRGCGTGLEAITPAKRRQLECAAEGWVSVHGDGDTTFRFDAVSVVREPGGTARLAHLEDAWRP